jgi:hypothetical protein
MRTESEFIKNENKPMLRYGLSLKLINLNERRTFASASMRAVKGITGHEFSLRLKTLFIQDGISQPQGLVHTRAVFATALQCSCLNWSG